MITQDLVVAPMLQMITLEENHDRLTVDSLAVTSELPWCVRRSTRHLLLDFGAFVVRGHLHEGV